MPVLPIALALLANLFSPPAARAQAPRAFDPDPPVPTTNPSPTKSPAHTPRNANSHASPAAGGAAAASNACTALRRLTFSSAAVEIDKADRIPAGKFTVQVGGRPPLQGLAMPDRCYVEGVIERRIGHDNQRYAIGFAVNLPERWNGRFLFQGGGGLNGTLYPPIGMLAAGDKAALLRGFAVVSTDSGHKGAVFDASFLADQDAALNFLYLSVGKVTTVAKQIITAYYRRPPAHSYFMGCSTGGREAMILSQRYPNEYDGIVAGAPAMRTNYSNLATRWVTTALNTAAPKDAEGKAHADQALSPADRKLVVDGLLKSCDALDGLADGMIFNTRACNFDPATLACGSAPKSESCLSSAQISAIKTGFSGPVTSRGIPVYPGFFYDTGIANAPPGIPGLLVSGNSPVGPSPTGTTIDVDAEAHAALDATSMAGDTNAWTNLSSYTAHGGKLIFYHGVSDPWFSARDTVDYYERLGNANGPAGIASWSRLFLVPGMGHCGGGGATLDQFDMIDAIVSWVENNQPPEQVIATGSAFPGRSRPLCAYPAHAQYDGTGDSESAANFSCAVD